MRRRPGGRRRRRPRRRHDVGGAAPLRPPARRDRRRARPRRARRGDLPRRPRRRRRARARRPLGDRRLDARLRRPRRGVLDAAALRAGAHGRGADLRAAARGPRSSSSRRSPRRCTPSATAARAVARLLDGHGVALRRRRRAALAADAGEVELADGRRLPAAAVVALPRLRRPAPRRPAPRRRGLRRRSTSTAASPGCDRVYAAGDVTDFPLKQGGLATQQADAAAEAMLADLGLPIVPRPFEPVLQGVLYTDDEPAYLRAPPTPAREPEPRPTRCGGRRARSPGATSRPTSRSAPGRRARPRCARPPTRSRWTSRSPTRWRGPVRRSAPRRFRRAEPVVASLRRRLPALVALALVGRGGRAPPRGTGGRRRRLGRGRRRHPRGADRRRRAIAAPRATWGSTRSRCWPWPAPSRSASSSPAPSSR